MKSNHVAHSNHSKRPTTRHTTAATLPPSRLPAPGMFASSILNNAHNNDIRDNTFVTNVKEAPPSLDVLYRRVAPNAILNAGGRADEVRCHPGTRKEVIRRIEKWADAQDDLAAPLFWLSGPAGAGKSAIMQTIAERRNQRGAPHANFFFFRGDPTRSHASPLVATLLHQIILLYPTLQNLVGTLLSSNPLIFDSTLEDQLLKVIVTPLRAIRRSLSSTYRPLTLLIDGLDECNSESKHTQQRILSAFDSVLTAHPGLFRLLVASRDESQIRAAFNGISSQCQDLYLDGQYSPDNDIRAFVTAQFRQIRKTHPLAHTLDGTWPFPGDINYIVEKSSGQFIYAATVMRFILNSSASPLVSLERVRGAARFVTKSPFSHLDAIYTYILFQANHQDLLNDILRATVLTEELRENSSSSQFSRGTHFSNKNRRSWPPHSHPRRNSLPPPPPPPPPLMDILRPQYTPTTVVSCLADLTPLCKFNPDSGQLLFYHASFSDYLSDQSRSGSYFADTMAFRYKILPIVWEVIANGQHNESWVDLGFGAMIQLQKLPPGLMSVLAPVMMKVWSLTNLDEILIFEKISNLCVRDDDVRNFRCFMRKWITTENLPRLDIKEIKTIRFSHRYFQMARAEHYRVAPDDEMITALHPDTDFDRRELTEWLDTLLHDFYEVVTLKPKQFTQLLKAWVSWAVLHDISCEGLLDLPGARRYIWWNMTKKWAHAFKRGSSKK